jgi:hypothetical protein
MEDVLETYKLPFNPARPVVCLDETNRQLIGETRNPLPAQPGQPALYDYEYVRNGVADLFMLFEPLAGRREVKVTESRTRKDFAACLRDLAYTHYREAEKIVLVMDNLNTHTLASLYAAFPPSEARRLAERFEIHYTPKHGSWVKCHFLYTIFFQNSGLIIQEFEDYLNFPETYQELLGPRLEDYIEMSEVFLDFADDVYGDYQGLWFNSILPVMSLYYLPVQN